MSVEITDCGKEPLTKREARAKMRHLRGKMNRTGEAGTVSIYRCRKCPPVERDGTTKPCWHVTTGGRRKRRRRLLG